MSTTTTGSDMSTSTYDVEALRAAFPILGREVNGHPLVYLDSAASTQKPREVIDAVRDIYETTYANVHRGVHRLSQEATTAYEAVREDVRRFLGAEHARECLFTRGTTEAVNLVANTWGRANLGPGDEIITTAMEHHSNFVPWQMLCEATGATLRIIPFDERGVLDLEVFDSLLGERTRLVALAHVSNALGTVHPIKQITARAHEVGAVVFIDGAQGAPHMKLDVQDLGVDFYAFSGHKVYGPTGIGVLYGRLALLEAMPPWHGGGDMIESVTLEGSTWAGLPHKFEAGTPNIAGTVGLGVALRFMERVGLEAIAAHEHALTRYGQARLAEIPGLRPIGTAPDKTSVLSFVLEGTHPNDVGMILDEHGIAIRTGHHCAQPTMTCYGVTATARASLGLYNTTADIDALIDGLHRVQRIFGTPSKETS